jgi:hypothetical protein
MQSSDNLPIKLKQSKRQVHYLHEKVHLWPCVIRIHYKLMWLKIGFAQ